MSIRDRLKRLEAAYAHRHGDILDWSDRDGCTWLMTFISTEREPASLAIREIVLSVGFAVVHGAAQLADELPPPEECALVHLLAALHAGGSCAPSYLDVGPAPEPPPTPRTWRGLERRLERLALKVRDARPEPDLSEIEGALWAI